VRPKKREKSATKKSSIVFGGGSVPDKIFMPTAKGAAKAGGGTADDFHGKKMRPIIVGSCEEEKKGVAAVIRKDGLRRGVSKSPLISGRGGTGVLNGGKGRCGLGKTQRVWKKKMLCWITTARGNKENRGKERQVHH